MFLSALLEVWILGAFGKPATSLPKPSLEILHSVHLEWTSRISTWSRVQWLKKTFQYTSSSHFPYSTVSLHGRPLRFRRPVQIRQVTRTQRPRPKSSRSLGGLFWQTGREMSIQKTPQLCEKTEEKPWENWWKCHEEQDGTSTIHLDVWWLFGNSSPTYDEPALLDQVAEPTRLTRLCIAGWVVWTFCHFCQSKSQWETRGMPKIWGPKPAPMSPKPWSVNLSGSTKLRPSFWSPEMPPAPRSLWRPGFPLGYDKSRNPGPPPLLWLPNYPSDGGPGFLDLSYISQWKARPPVIVPLHNCEDPPSKRSSEQAWKMPMSRYSSFLVVTAVLLKNPWSPSSVCTWHFQPAMWSFGSSPRTPGLRLEGYAATCSTCRWD